MFYSNERADIRNLYFNAWQKYIRQQDLEALEQQIVNVIIDHPEYHAMFNDPDTYLDKDYTPEMGQTNPYLHMGLHLAIRDQVATNLPQGINQIYTKLMHKSGDPLEAEHALMSCLADLIWKTQQSNQAPDMNSYLEQCKSLL